MAARTFRFAVRRTGQLAAGRLPSSPHRTRKTRRFDSGHNRVGDARSLSEDTSGV
jgi:hypothetical protein